MIVTAFIVGWFSGFGFALALAGLCVFAFYGYRAVIRRSTGQ